MARLAIILLVFCVSLIVIDQAYAQQNKPPKVDIFARQIGDKSILVTWENPDDVATNIVYRYTVGKEVNKTGTFTPIFDSLRNIEQKILDINGREMFFYLDNDIKAGSYYAYSVSAGNIKGNPNPTKSDDTRPIYINPRISKPYIEGKGFLITGKPIVPINPIMSFFSWLNPFDNVQAIPYSNSIFTTPLNPTAKSYRLKIEPIPSFDLNTNCEQVLEFGYSRSADDGQDFDVMVSIIEIYYLYDDEDTPQYRIEERVLNQKLFSSFSDNNNIRHKTFSIPKNEQKIGNFSNIEVQYDITGKFVLNPLDYRSFTLWDNTLMVPNGEC